MEDGEFIPCNPLRTKLDMKQQLVIWKKVGYLLDNISMNKEFTDKLVDNGLFDKRMMDEIYTKEYSVERTLVMLSLLGQLGDNCYEKFLHILKETKHKKIVPELRKTETFTYFGEMLPPVFTYFLDMSEFLRLYPHIAIKLSEDEKHILQCFIDGKIDMSTRKIEETNKKLHEIIRQLKLKIVGLNKEILELQEREAALRERILKDQEKIEALMKKIGELEHSVYEWKCEVRRLKHFRTEQEELQMFIGDEGKGRKIGDSPMAKLAKLPTFIESRKAKNTSSVKLKLLSAQVEMSVNKLYYVQGHMQQLDYLERRLHSFIGKPTGAFDKETLQDMHNVQNLLLDTKKEKKTILDELTTEEEEIMLKEQEIDRLRMDVLGKSGTPDFRNQGHASLRTDMMRLIDHIESLNKQRIEAINVAHFKEIQHLMDHIKEINYAHNKDKEVIKWRLRVKMGELHRREMLHRRMKHLIMVLCRYHAKNMNATVSVEQCRKIVRGIIGDSRKLRKMVDEAEQLEKNPQGNGPPTEEEDQKEKEERERKEKEEEEKKRSIREKKRRRKKEVDYLKNERLMFVADRLMGEWRQLGIHIGLSMNRMDMIEVEVPAGATPDTIGYVMLKTWRDEIKGKIGIKAGKLVKGLLKMGRKDLAIIVLPMHRVELLTDEIKEEEKQEELKAEKEKEEEEQLKKEQELELQDLENIEREVMAMETRRDDVPTFPEIKA